MKKLLIALFAALALAAPLQGCSLLQKDEQVQFAVDEKLPKFVQETQAKVLNVRLDLAAFALAIDSNERAGLLTTEQAKKLMAKVIAARDALDEIQRLIGVGQYVTAMKETNLKSAAKDLLRQEIAEELAKHLAAKKGQS